jgi:integrase
MNLSEELEKIKPGLAASSIRNYVIQVEKIHEKITGNKTIENFDFLKDYEKVFDTLKEMKAPTRRNYLNAAVVFLQAFPDYKTYESFKKYSEERDRINDELKEQRHSGVKTEKQKENWITTEEYNKILDIYKKNFSKNKIVNELCPDKREVALLQEYALLKLYQQIPSRNDYASIKILKPAQYRKIKDEKLTQNYLITERDKYYFIVNTWKTKKDENDRRRIDVPPDIKKILKLLMSKQPGEYLFLNKSGSPLTRNGLTKYLQSIFKRFYPNKNVSSSMLRVMFCTDKHSDAKTEMEKDAKLLAHSMCEQQAYIKNKED